MGNYDDGAGFDRLVCGCDFPDDAVRINGEQSLSWTKSHTTAPIRSFYAAYPKRSRSRRDITCFWCMAALGH